MRSGCLLVGPGRIESSVLNARLATLRKERFPAVLDAIDFRVAGGVINYLTVLARSTLAVALTIRSSCAAVMSLAKVVTEASL